MTTEPILSERTPPRLAGSRPCKETSHEDEGEVEGWHRDHHPLPEC